MCVGRHLSLGGGEVLRALGLPHPNYRTGGWGVMGVFMYITPTIKKKSFPAGAVVRGTDKGYDHASPGPRLKPGSERPVEKVDQKYPYMRPRDAATLILVRQRGKVPEVLLGCRDAKHAFMPNRYVFPGGRVDRA